RVIDRRAGRIHHTSPLSEEVEGKVDLSSFGVEVLFRSGAGHRAALAFRRAGLGACVSSNDPKKEGIQPPAFLPLRDSAADRKTTEALNEFIRQSLPILAKHTLNQDRRKRGLPLANMILVRGAGQMGTYEP